MGSSTGQGQKELFVSYTEERRHEHDVWLVYE
jgi:hypothetical protein